MAILFRKTFSCENKQYQEGRHKEIYSKKVVKKSISLRNYCYLCNQVSVSDKLIIKIKKEELEY